MLQRIVANALVIAGGQHLQATQNQRSDVVIYPETASIFIVLILAAHWMLYLINYLDILTTFPICRLTPVVNQVL